MNPQAGDVFRMIATFLLADGSLMQNIFTALLTATVANDWDDLATPISQWLGDVYDNWMNEVADEVTGQTLDVQVRDTGLGEWNQVGAYTLGAIVGQDIATSMPGLNSGTGVAYPAKPRNRGFKNFPPPSIANVVDGRLTLTALASLGVSTGVWAAGYNQAGNAWSSGTYTLSTETFNPFVGSIAFTDTVGSRVTRKTGRGI